MDRNTKGRCNGDVSDRIWEHSYQADFSLWTCAFIKIRVHYVCNICKLLYEEYAFVFKLTAYRCKVLSQYPMIDMWEVYWNKALMSTDNGLTCCVSQHIWLLCLVVSPFDVFLSSIIPAVLKWITLQLWSERCLPIKYQVSSSVMCH